MIIWRTAIVGGLVGLGLCGCDEPSNIIPVAPPGANIPRVSPDAEPAQAQGETAPTSTSPPSAAKSAKVANMKLAPPTAKGETKTTAGGVKYETLKEGTGRELKPGEMASIHYEGKLVDGSVFDSSRERKAPFDAMIGVKPLIAGWEEGIPGMKIGEVRKLTIPPEMAYGAKGHAPKVPSNATLIFEVELLGIQ